MTNFEAIKAMPDSLLAVFLSSMTSCYKCPNNDCDGNEHRCVDNMLKWLRSEET